VFSVGGTAGMPDGKFAHQKSLFWYIKPWKIWQPWVEVRNSPKGLNARKKSLNGMVGSKKTLKGSKTASVLNAGVKRERKLCTLAALTFHFITFFRSFCTKYVLQVI
jgi:hypothetical protein